MDSTIEKLPDRTIVTTGGVVTCFGGVDAAAEQIALLQQEIVRLRGARPDAQENVNMNPREPVLASKRDKPRVCCDCGARFVPTGMQRNCHVDATDSGWQGFSRLDGEYLGRCPDCPGKEEA